MNLIEELYYGNIHPIEKSYNKDSQYAKASDEFCKNEKILIDSLAGDELKCLNILLEASNKILDYTGVENFKLGFTLGVRLITDCYKNNDYSIFKDI